MRGLTEESRLYFRQALEPLFISSPSWKKSINYLHLLMLRRFRSRCTLKDIESCVSACAARMGVEVRLFQTSDLAQCIQRLKSSQEDAVVINPGRCAQR